MAFTPIAKNTPNWDEPLNAALSTMDTQLAANTAQIGANTAQLATLLNPEMHRNIFRGKYLGDVVTDAQKAAIRDSSFDDLFVGDYWTIGDVNWRIVDINYWLLCGDVSFTTPHLVIMPDVSLYNARMNTTNTTAGGYVGSLMYTTNLETAKTTITDTFGDMVLTHREYLTNAVTDGHASAGAWFDSTVELPNEIMMYGSYIFAAAGDGTFVPTRYTINKSQLALCRMVPQFIHNRQIFWLRDVASAAAFADVGIRGRSICDAAAYSYGVRPVFAIG